MKTFEWRIRLAGSMFAAVIAITLMLGGCSSQGPPDPGPEPPACGAISACGDTPSPPASHDSTPPGDDSTPPGEDGTSSEPQPEGDPGQHLDQACGAAEQALNVINQSGEVNSSHIVDLIDTALAEVLASDDTVYLYYTDQLRTALTSGYPPTIAATLENFVGLCNQDGR